MGRVKFESPTSEAIYKLTKNWGLETWEDFRSRNDYWKWRDEMSRQKLQPETNKADLDRRFKNWKLKLIKEYDTRS